MTAPGTGSVASATPALDREALEVAAQLLEVSAAVLRLGQVAAAMQGIRQAVDLLGHTARVSERA